jgi:hypothetical protein
MELETLWAAFGYLEDLVVNGSTRLRMEHKIVDIAFEARLLPPICGKVVSLRK